MLVIKSHEHTPHEQVALIRVKLVIYAKFVQLREIGESDLEQIVCARKPMVWLSLGKDNFYTIINS